MNTIKGWLNIYRNGYFHRAGKPYTLDRQSGDIYATYEDAVREIEPLSHYIATVPVQWQEDGNPTPNPADSVPIPLWKTRPAKVLA